MEDEQNTTPNLQLTGPACPQETERGASLRPRFLGCSLCRTTRMCALEPELGPHPGPWFISFFLDLKSVIFFIKFLHILESFFL